MTQTTDRIADEFAKFMTDAAGFAQGMKREADTFVKTQAERLLRDMDLPSREEFEAVREMAVKAREENEALRARIDALEAQLQTAAKTRKGDK
jgi:BMFP domain-containing protein YqiC